MARLPRAGWEDWEVLVGNMWLNSRILPALIKIDLTKITNLELGKYTHHIVMPSQYIQGALFHWSHP